MASKGTRNLKHPILKDVDYASILKNKKSVLEIDGKDLEGKTWREFQIFLGDRLPINHYYFNIKFKKSSNVFTGTIRAVSIDNKKTEVNMEGEEILKEFKSLKDQISKASDKGGISFDMLLNATKQGYEARIDYLNQKIADKDELIREIKKNVDELEDDLNDCEKESAKHSGIGQYLAIGEKILNMKFGSPAKVSLKESNSSDIPEQILQVLGVIDWSKIDQASIERIATGIQQYISVIPKEFFKGE